jgi:sialate O-acetylesterase
VENPDGWKTHRVYSVPPGLLHVGPNVILIRIIDRYGPAGFGSNPEALHLDSASGSRVSLAGNWQIRVETSLGRRPFLPEKNVQYLAGTLFDGMIHPLVPYALRGVIWYQGESNAPRAQQYRRLFPQMIQSWRDAWDQGDFPFYFVQLANFQARQPEPQDSNWAELREAQLMTLAEPKTGLAVTIDLGEEKDIHPRNKKGVGERLALWALAQDYGVTETPGFWGRIPFLKNLVRRPLTHSGPLYKEFSIEDSRIRLTFDHVAEGLVNRAAGPLPGFAIAGDDKKFVWADARIDGPTVVVSSPQVPKPVAVRYAWANNPEVSLYNSAGLPASPFRTDTWPGITDGLR